MCFWRFRILFQDMKSLISIILKSISSWNIVLNQILCTLKYLTVLLLNLLTWICLKTVLKVGGSVLFYLYSHLQRQPWKHQINVWNTLKDNFKSNRPVLFCFPYCELLTDFIYCSGVSILGFRQVNVSWAVHLLYQQINNTIWNSS